MNVTLTHPVPGFTGNVNLENGAAVLGFTGGTCSVDLDPRLFEVVESAGITLTIGTPPSPPPYDANTDTIIAPIVAASTSLTGQALKAAYAPKGDLRAFNIYMPENYGAKGAVVLTDASITSGQTALTSTSYSFKSSDVGAIVYVNGAGAASANLVTTIASVSSGTATLAAAAGTTVSAVQAAFGPDDSTGVQGALTVASAVNATVLLGTNYIIPTGGLTVTGRIKVIGHGGVDGNINATSALLCPSLTADVITFTVDGFRLRDFAVINIASDTPTAGTGIRATRNWWAHVDSVDTFGFWNNMSFEGGCYYEVTGCFILDPVNYGVFMTDVANQDYGECQFHANVISLWKTTRHPQAAVRWESGGGLKFFGNKINGAFQPPPGNAAAGDFQYGFDLAIQDGLSTVDCLIETNSIENIDKAFIRLTQKGPANTGAFHNLVITGNEMGYGGAPTSYGVVLQPGAFNFMGSVVIGNNTFINVAHCSIYAKWIDSLTINTNQHKNCATSSSDAYHHIVYLDGGCYNAQVAMQNSDGDAKWLYYNADVGDTTTPYGHNGRSRLDHNYVREIPTCTSTSTYVTLYRFVIPTYWAGLVDVTVNGGVKNVGSFLIKQSRAVNLDGAGNNVVLTTVGTDVAAGPGATDAVILLDNTSVPGELQVKVKLGTANAAGTDVFGTVSVNWPSGGVQSVKRGA